MTRKVGLLIVIAIVAALAASSAAVIVLANEDGHGASAPTGPAGGAWHEAWREGLEAPAAPMMGCVAGWERHGEAPLLPWVLFAVATGTAVGLLIAWSPWRAQTVTAGPPENGGGSAAQVGVARETGWDEIATGDVVTESTLAGDTASGATVNEADLTASGSVDAPSKASATDDAPTQETPRACRVAASAGLQGVLLTSRYDALRYIALHR